MSAQHFRLPEGGRIDRSETLRFSFDGARYEGHPGDSVASALLANGVRLYGRSFKYHRPRGLLAAGVEEPNAILEIGEGARREPNTRATAQELYEGLVARSQNRWPSLSFDIGSINQLFAPFLVGGFYYKTFMWPGFAWEEVYEKVIRKAAGLGRASGLPDPDRYEHENVFCDVLIAGGGPAGLAAALAAGRSGARVVIADENPLLGGALLRERETIDGAPASSWLEAAQKELAGLENVVLLTRATVFGLYEHGVAGIVQRITDHLAEKPGHLPRQKVFHIRAQRTIIATGALERPLVFAGNDKPGVMLASAVRTYVERYGVTPGKRVVIATNNDDAYKTAIALRQAGVDVPVLADARKEPGAIANEVEALGVEVRPDTLPRTTQGYMALGGVALQSGAGEPRGDLGCDCLAVSGGWSPAVHLATMIGGKAVWDAARAAFVPGAARGDEAAAGAALGLFGLAECLESGAEAGAAAARACGHEAKADAPRADARIETPILPVWRAPGEGKAFVDFQNDVTVKDIVLAEREGYKSVEHAKRYTTMGMATDQGKTGNVNGLAILAEARGQPIQEVGTTTFRPYYTPVAFGALAGHAVGQDFAPHRRSPIHGWHEEHGAVFVEAGHWLRPQHYPQGAEDIAAATYREAKAVRASVGLCDVSTLGKIDLFGPDAGEFLNRLYTNAFAKLPVGKARYGVMLREDGHVFDDGTTTRIANDHFFMTTTTAGAAEVLAHMELHHQRHWPELDVAFCSATDQWAAMALAGPNSRKTLAKIVDQLPDVSDAALPFMGYAEGSAGGLPIRVFRISFSGELAYEIQTPAEHGRALWERCMEAGREFAIVPYGVEALGVLRIEKGHVAGQELDGRTTATDLGLSWALSKKKPYLGQALSTRPALADPARPRLVGIEAIAPDTKLRGGALLVRDLDRPVSEGWVSSIAYSPALERWIGLAFVERGAERHGEELFAYYPMKREMVPVRLASPHFVDPEGARLRG